MNNDVFVGVDVGGARKGFHAIALQRREIKAKLHSLAVSEVADWCHEQQARGVAVDAPCRWSHTGRARAAERELARVGIFAFATPSRALAESKGFYAWMLNGMELYKLIERHFPLFPGHAPESRFCIETFPQAVACALAGKVLPAKAKKTNRPAILRAEGIDTTSLTSMDYIDATLCALAARYVVKGAYKAYGDESGGSIVVPSVNRNFRPSVNVSGFFE